MMKYPKIICTALCLLCFCVGAHSQDTKAQEERKAKLEREIAIIDRQLAENASKSSTMLADLNLIRKKVANRKELVAQSDRQIKKYNDEIYLAQLEINKINRRIETLTDHYSKLVVSAYKNRDARVWYMYMLASDNLGQAFRRFGYFRNLSEQMKSEAQKIRAAKAELEEEKEKLSEKKKEAEEIKAERVKELDNLRKDESKADNVVKQLKKSRNTYQKQLNSKKKEVQALNKEIEKMISAAMGEGKSSSKSKTVVDQKLAAEFVKNKGKLPWPVEGAVVGRFGSHKHPVYNIVMPQNNGFDLAVSKGEEAKAVFDGVVRQVMVLPGYNQCVMIDHGEYYTLYCKLRNVKVKADDKVKTGDVLGTVDTINGQTQLHFELWQGKKAHNPENWLK
ncbi:MAG: peptidoglycan DD-metalloendopeptidase family protein [Bacteroidales bacterium]|nr:peptidoglycan DD-metalloendopeptidase family protein [Bacteroidales bacterium]